MSESLTKFVRAATDCEGAASPGRSPLGRAPLVSVIIVNWNGVALLPECLAAMTRQSYPHLEVIVVDNGSTDGSVSFVRSAYGRHIALIESDRNRGFAGGNNLGIRQAKGTYVALLNNDAVAEPGWVEALVHAAERDSRVGICASRIYAYGTGDILDGAGLLLSLDGIGRGRGRLERGEAFAHEEDVLLASGCAALYRRAMLDEIGLFDEDFFAYCEDSDLGLRAWIAGWRCRYVPDAVVHHKYSGSTAPYSAFKAFHVERNRLWLVVKCFPLRLIVASLFFTPLRYAVQAYGVLRGQGAAGRMAQGTPLVTMLTVLARAWTAAMAGLPVMLRRRRHVQSLRRIPAQEFRRSLRAHRIGLRELALKD